MKSSVRTLILVSVLAVTACIPSLHPLYTDADLTADPAMVGSWVDQESGETWSFSNSGKLKYTLVHADSNGLKSEYDARLVKVADKLFLDIVPAKSAIQNTSVAERFIATHTFVHITRKDSTMQVSYMEPRWLKDFLAANPRAVRHEKVNGEIVLTSSPKETQKFVLDHLNTHEAFSPPAQFSRR